MKNVLIMAMLLLFSSVSCVRVNIFEPDKLPDADIKSSIVSTPSPVYRGGKDLITIESIDGRAPTFMENKAIVEPGLHVFQVRIEIQHDSRKLKERKYITRADTSISLDVEAQKHYLIDAREDADGLWVWIINTDTKEIVAGTPPKRAEQ